MKRVVLDTNIIISALWSKSGSPAKIFEMFINGDIILCYDTRIINEYKGVLNRPEFAFRSAKIGNIINRIRSEGIAVVAKPCNIEFTDEDDRMFYEVAKECNAILITGNTRHYPKDIFIKPQRNF